MKVEDAEMLDFGAGPWIQRSLVSVNCADGPIMTHVSVCLLPAMCFEGS